MSRIPPRPVFAAYTRRLVVEQHTEWDSLHHFHVLHWDGAALAPHTVYAIDPHIHPDRYPGMMMDFGSDAIKEQLGEGPPSLYGFALQIEAHSVAIPAGMGAAREAALHRQHAAWRLHEHPLAEETCNAWVADIHGRLWSAVKFRLGGDVREDFARPGSTSGQMPAALLACAYGAGQLLYGLPAPGGAR